MLLNNMTQLKEIVFQESGAPFLAIILLCAVKQAMLLPWDWGSLSVTGELWMNWSSNIANSLVLQELSAQQVHVFLLLCFAVV